MVNVTKNKDLFSKMTTIAAQGARDAVTEVAANPDCVPAVFQRLGAKGDRDAFMDIREIVTRFPNLMQERPDYVDLAVATLAEHPESEDALLEMVDIAKTHHDQMFFVLGKLSGLVNEHSAAVESLKEVLAFGKKTDGRGYLAVSALAVLLESDREEAQGAARSFIGLDPHTLLENMDVLGLIKDTGGDFRTAFESQINAIVNVFKNEDTDSLEDTADLMAALAVLSENNATSDDPFQTVVKVHEDKLGRRVQKAIMAMRKDRKNEHNGERSSLSLLKNGFENELTHDD